MTDHEIKMDILYVRKYLQRAIFDLTKASIGETLSNSEHKKICEAIETIGTIFDVYDNEFKLL